MAEATRFYEKLGWNKASHSNERVTFFQSTGAILCLFGRTSLASDAGLEDQAFEARMPGFRGFTISQNTSSREEVDAVFAHAIRNGAVSTKPPCETFWGGYSGYFADPDGNLWEIAYNPFAPLDENGHMQL